MYMNIANSYIAFLWRIYDQNKAESGFTPKPTDKDREIYFL